MHVNAVTRRQRRASHAPASCLPTTVVSRGHAHNTCTRKNFKPWGTQHRLEYYPSSPTRKASAPDHSLEGYWYLQGGTEVHRFMGFLGIRSAEVVFNTTSPRQTKPVTRQTYPPCCMFQSRNIW